VGYTSANIYANFDAEAGDTASLVMNPTKLLWFNEGQARLTRFQAKHTDITWSSGDRYITLPSGFVQIDKIIHDTTSTVQSWRVFGTELVIEDPRGATSAGTARLYYRGEWPNVVDGGQNSLLSAAGDVACLYFALHRFYRLLASNRSYYKRYSTLQGANSVSMAELQSEADRYLQDFIDSRADLEPLPIAAFFGG
jgi:hypothetical protein